MSKKIIAIGGGGSVVDLKNFKEDCELNKVYNEIVMQANKDNPNFLFLAHSRVALPLQNFCYNVNNILEEDKLWSKDI